MTRLAALPGFLLVLPLVLWWIVAALIAGSTDD